MVFLSMAPTWYSSELVPDYTAKVMEMCRALLLLSVRRTSRLTLMLLSGKPEAPDWPSWVPDFRARKSLLCGLLSVGYCSTAVSGTVAATQAAQSVMELPGVVLESITGVTFLSPVSLTILRQQLGRLGVDRMRLSPYVRGGSLLDAYCMTFAMGKLHDRYPFGSSDP
jgi:hypothetical protein